MRIGLAVLAGAGIVVAVFLGALWWYAEQRIDREEIDAIGEREHPEIDEPVLNFLVIGSDSREGLTEEEQQDLELGDFEGRRADTILLVQVGSDRDEAAIVSIPRDLRMRVDGDITRINTLVEDGPELLVRAVESIAGLDIDHYVEISIPGFLGVVEAIGTVEICLEQRLRDRRSGADFSAGCHDMSAEESLAYVRSREGARGDFERIGRQQRFVRAVIDEMTAARNLLNPTRLVRIVDRVSDNLRTDQSLGVRRMRALAEEMRSVVEGEVATTTVPAYPSEANGAAYVTTYEPGAQALFRELRQGRLPADRGSEDERAEVTLGIWSGGQAQAARRVESTLFFAGFRPEVLGPGPVETPTTTIVYPVGSDRESARWVAAVLGGRVEDPPQDVQIPDVFDVVVVVGEDAQMRARTNDRDGGTTTSGEENQP